MRTSVKESIAALKTWLWLLWCGSGRAVVNIEFCYILHKSSSIILLQMTRKIVVGIVHMHKGAVN